MTRNENLALSIRLRAEQMESESVSTIQQHASNDQILHQSEMAADWQTHVAFVERSMQVTQEKGSFMNSNSSTNHGKNSDDKKAASQAASKPEACTNIHDGKVVSMAGDKLTTTCDAGKQHCHTIAKDAHVTCDGQASKAADLKAGTHVRVTTHKDDKTIATAIESGKKHSTPAHKA